MNKVNLNLTWAVPATIAIAAIWGVSACANWYAGASFGDSSVFNFLLFQTTTSQIFSVASLSADILKTVMLFAATAALATRNFRAAGVTGGIWFVCTVWSVISATGFVAFNQGNVTDGRGKSVAEWSQLERQIERNEQKRAEVKPHRPQKDLQAEIDGILRIPGIDGCAVINGPVTRQYCPQLTALRQELAHAESAIWLDAELERLRKEMKSAERVTSENPWAELVAGLTTATASQAMTGRALLFAFMLELISGPGFWALWVAYASTLRAKPLVPAIIPRKQYTPSLTLPVKPETRAVTETPEPPAPAPSPDDGGMPQTPSVDKPDGTEPEQIVTAELYDFPSKEPPRTKKQRKHALREKQDRERSQMIGDFVYECLDIKADAAKLTRTKSGGYASGGTKGSVIYDLFVRWCDRNGAEVINKSHFGRNIKDHVEAARATKGVYYGAVIRAAVAKRKAA